VLIKVAKLLTLERWRPLFNAIKSHASFEEIDFSGFGRNMSLENNTIECFASALSVNSNIKRVHLVIMNEIQLRMMADALLNPSCSLEEMLFSFATSKQSPDWFWKLWDIHHCCIAEELHPEILTL
jgi:hypothetical protein